MSSSGYSTASDGAVGGGGGGGFRERADRGRAVEGYLVLVLSAIALAIGVSRFATSKAPLGTMLVVGAALYGAGRISMSRRVQRSADYWHQGSGFIQFGPSRGLGLGGQVFWCGVDRVMR